MKYQDWGYPLVYVDVGDEWKCIPTEEAEGYGVECATFKSLYRRNTEYDFIFYNYKGWHTMLKRKGKDGRYIHQKLHADDLPAQVKLLFILAGN